MPPKKKAVSATKATAAAAKAVPTVTPTPPSSPAKEVPPTPARPSVATSPHKSNSHSPQQQQQQPVTPKFTQKGQRRSPSVADANTPKRASPPQSFRTPERQGSHNGEGSPKAHHHQQQQQQKGSTTPRARDGAASPSAPPAPASTPVPASDRTPRRDDSAVKSRPAASSPSPVISLSASPVAPPTTPVPQPKQQPSSPRTPPSSSRKERSVAAAATAAAAIGAAAAAAASTPATAKSATPTPAPFPPPQKENTVTATEEAGLQVASKALSRNGRRLRIRHAAHDSVGASHSHSVEHLIRESKVIAPDVSGVRCLAVHPSETQVIVARENGSLVLYDLSFFQNIPQFVQRRHTGGQTKRTITSLAYVAVPAATTTAATFSDRSTGGSGAAAAAANAAASTRYVLLASMMSGQVVVYDADLLVPLALHQRSGGAIWQMTAVNHACVYAAMADSSWQQLRLVCRREGSAPQMELVRVVPGISGADRALTVATSQTLRMAVGSDDAGNVHAWHLPPNALANMTEEEEAAEASGAAAANAHHRNRGLAEHESLWTTKLAKGIALSCAVVGGAQRPCVVVGTSMGDVVLLDAAHGHVFQTFSQHKGPVTTLAVQSDAVVFASGWHESLRSYRCSSEGDWYPAEVKRRTHYHEASQLALLPHRQLVLSASRDGTIMYAPTAQLFHAPAMYVVVTTQQFAYAASRGVLLQSRFDGIETFTAASAGRFWGPLFGYRLEGRFHLSGLWCDERLDYIVFSTEERVGLLKVGWRAEGAMAITRIAEVLELPAGTGVVDVCWKASSASVAAAEDEEAEIAAAAAVPTPNAHAVSRVLYILYDDKVTSVTLAEGYPTVHTALQVRGKGLVDDSIRPHRVFCRPTSSSSNKDASSAAAAAASLEELVIYGHCGGCRLQLMADGTPDADTLVADLDDVFELVSEVPVLCPKPTEQDSKRVKVEAVADDAAPVVATSPALVGLSSQQQHYISGPVLHATAAGTSSMPTTLPHDVHWIAQVAPAKPGKPSQYLGYFSRGLLVASGETWRMVRRMNVEAAFVTNGGSEVLVLERNLEKTLEALPLTWKVRRFGN